MSNVVIMTKEHVASYVEGQLRRDMRQITTRLSGLPSERAAQFALGLAADLVEYAAYEMAGERSSATVSRLILTAAELEQFAEGPEDGLPAIEGA